MKLSYISIFQNRCQSRLETCSFSYSLHLVYCSFFHIFEKETKNLSICILFLFFLLLTIIFSFLRRKATRNQMQLFTVVIVLFSFSSINLVHNKSEVFHLLRMTKKTEPPLLDLKVLYSNPKIHSVI